MAECTCGHMYVEPQPQPCVCNLEEKQKCGHDMKFLVYALEEGEVGGCLECARQLIKQNSLAG